MSVNVLLIYPPSQRIFREDRCMVPAKNPIMSPSLPPTDLLYMASAAERGGSVCKIADYTCDLTIDHLLDDIRSLKPDYLIISTTTPTLHDDLRICSPVKDIFPNVRIIAKGSYFIKNGIETMARYPELDMIIRGEAEATVREIVSGKSHREIAGLVWRGPGGIAQNRERPFIQDVDALPFPARHLIDNNRFIRPDTGDVQGVIKVSRGCPYHCFFCLATPVSGSRVRMRSPENILEEIKICIKNYGMRDFLFWSDLFNFDRAWVLELCRAIANSGMRFNWSANARADKIDREIAQAMREAGCWLVSVGVESGNQDILNKVGKGTTLDQIREAFDILQGAKLTTLAYYLIGLPWETMETAEDTIRFAIELDSDFASFFTATPFPGTKYLDYALAHDLMPPGSSEGNGMFKDAYYSPTIRGHYLSRVEIARLRRDAIRRFYIRPAYIIKRARRLRSWKELYNYARAALSLMRTA